jgi:hypothetical protein
MDNQRQIEINRSYRYLVQKEMERERQRLDRVYYFVVTLAVTTTLVSVITYINLNWSA